MNKFLLDISTQELPYQFIPNAISSLKLQFEKLFNENEIKYGNLNVYGSPRHLVVHADSLSKNMSEQNLEIKGPILNIALDETGNYTKAAVGFAKKNNVDTESLIEKDGYIWAKVVKKSKTIKEILEINVETIIMSLQGSHFMRWASNSEKFSRPIEHVLAMLDKEILKNIKIIDVYASNKTSGHRFSSMPVVEINDIDNYIDSMKKACVYINQNERCELIKKLSLQKADEVGLSINFDSLDDLFEELTYITEYPNPIVCEFEEQYLDIPSIVTTTVMTKHQRYIPLYEKNGELSNKFIAVSNYIKDSEFANIINGNQRVVKARLEDGLFFFKEDTKTNLESKVDKLSGITFQKNLGSMKDKTNRLILLSEYLSDVLNLNNNDKKNTLRCAKLSKADLATSLVFEFTELQGYIGEVYAKKSLENDSVACGIKEHYFPFASESILATTIEGTIVGLADKIDTICAVFLSTQKELKKKRPTGSNDPLGIRRAAVGVLRTIIEKRLDINLVDFINKSINIISDEFNINIEQETQSEIENFILSRYSSILQNKYPKDVIDSKLFCALESLNSFESKLDYICRIKEYENYQFIKDNFTRILRLLKTNKINCEISTSLFEYQEENDLLDQIKIVDTTNIYDLNKLAEKIQIFFDKVLVMSDDEKIKNNRIALLNLVSNLIISVCDFEKLI